MSSPQPAPEKRTRARKAEAPDSNAAAPAAELSVATPRPLFIAPIGVRWRDLDAFNHVNNANYLTYLEEARLQWLRHVPGWFDEHSMPVLAASEINYRRPIEWPAQLQVELRCERLGNSSITLAHRIVDTEQADCLYSDGKVVMVWMDPTTGKPVPLPQAIRDAAAASA
ncbi:acyl-CoA thioesterase [Dyella solisilvae]|uniref:Acyl-CoA thioesterase n=1 Tax=Dyella solisilvae TaxID=1920168 RepID=A0A370KAS8_9GAMM|nr:thioesterase family protein [Dyella solisilvae]RDI99772.1 acyl-CoA thioesterase [Dyella solisilvae]